jgi:hypothetical protein
VTAIALAAASSTVPGLAQDETAKALAERSAIVVAGRVVRVNASLEPLQPASPQTVVIMVSRMYSGAEIAGDQKGRMATVVLSSAARPMKAGTEALFFGNPRFIGTSLTIASEGELVSGAAGATSADVSLGVQGQRDQPLRERIAAASSIFRGRVESERPLATGAGQAGASDRPPSEHDPDWHVASVRVLTSLQGSAQSELMNVLFPASRDIVWFNAPKLTVGQEAIFITHKADRDDPRLMRAPAVAALLAAQPVEIVSQPFDTVPVADEGRIRALIARAR